MTRTALLLATAVAAFSATAMTSCLSFHAGDFGDNIRGRDVEKDIDAWADPRLHAYDPRLTIQPSRCPDHIDVSDGKHAMCTVVVDGVALPIRVDYHGPPQRYQFDFPGSFYETRSLERRLEASLLGDHDLIAQAHCPGPSVMVVAAGTKMTCSLAGVPRHKSTELRFGDKGMVYFQSPKDLPKSTLQQTLTDVAKRHQTGSRAVIAGAPIASVIDHDIAQSPRVLADSRLSGGKTHCPATVDLTEANRGVCVVQIAGLKWRWVVWIDKSGTFHWQPLDALVDLSSVQEQVKANLDRQLEASGSASTATVDCGSGLTTSPVPGRFYCVATAEGTARRVLVEVIDYRGTFRWRVLNEGG